MGGESTELSAKKQGNPRDEKQASKSEDSATPGEKIASKPSKSSGIR